LSGRSASFSPTKRSTTTPNINQRQQLIEDSDDDEETLQLKLQAIEAKLKLKKLQQQKARTTNSDVENEGASRPASAAEPIRSRPLSRYLEERERPFSRPGSQQNQVQVPLSPIKKQIPVESKSPGRVLGKDRKATDVSLGRAPSLRKRSAQQDPFTSSHDPKPSRYGSIRSRSRSPDHGFQVEKKSFSERMAESRSVEKSRQDKIDERQRNRSTGFRIDSKELERYEFSARETELLNTIQSKSPAKGDNQSGFSREEVLRAFTKPQGESIRRSNTTGRIQSRRRDHSPFNTLNSVITSMETDVSNSNRPSSSASQQLPTSSRPVSTEEEVYDRPNPPAPNSASFEPFSSVHLSKRILPHGFLNRTFSTTTTMLVPEVLHKVRHPSYEPPECEGDWVVLGVVASKSSPMEQKNNGPKKVHDPSARSPKRNDDANARNKYMALTLTDLKYSVDLFLFGTAFNRYYKLTPGTVIAILNPNILPPPPHRKDTHIFSLSVTSADDTILEIGTAKDLGFCKAVRKDGKICNSWLDARHTEFCTFHIEHQVQKAKSSRMEVNTGVGLFGPGGRRGGGNGHGHSNNSKRPNEWSGEQRNKGLLPDKSGSKYDKSTGTSYFITPSLPRPSQSRGNPNAAGDDENFSDDDPFLSLDHLSRGARQDRLQRRLADIERERDIARKLGGTSGGSMGGEYLRLKHGDQANTQGSSSSSGANAAGGEDGEKKSLGIDTKRKAEAVKLSPIKKTRFLTSKGIREAGRDSFGPAGNRDEGDDDGLDIV
jgi:minichromosome maintenance protein 10